MAWDGVLLFENASNVLGEDVGFRRCGRLVGVDASAAAVLEAGMVSRRALGIDVQRVDPTAVPSTWPEIDTEGFAVFAHEPRGGYADTRRTARAFGRAARHGGAGVLRHAPVAAVRADGDRVTGVWLTDGRAIATGTVVVAAGADSAALVAPLGVDLPIGVAHEFAIRADTGRVLGERPVLVDLIGRQDARAHGSGRLLLGAWDPTPPGARDELIARAGARFAARFPGFRSVTFTASFNTRRDTTPDHRPLIGAAGPDGLFVAAGCGEHGLGIVPAVGRLVADLLCDGASSRPDIPGTDFRPDRFTERPRSPRPRSPESGRPAPKDPTEPGPDRAALAQDQVLSPDPGRRPGRA
jgi:glycine/D-amino acid oxidase-like deaminating enzyme